MVAQEEDRLYSRENSTLVFATVAASASLLILTFVLQNFVPPLFSWIANIGFVFSILGPLYREVTIFTIDLSDYRRIGKTEYRWWEVIPRMIIVRFFLFLPIAAWSIFFTSSMCLLTTVTFTFVVALLLSVVEWVSRVQHAHLQQEPMRHEEEKAQPPQTERRERTTRNADEWFWETFSIVTNSLFIASLTASVPAHGLDKMLWGGSALGFGSLFCSVRLAMGLRIHAPRLHISLIAFFLIVAVIMSLFTIEIGYLQLTGRLP